MSASSKVLIIDNGAHTLKISTSQPSLDSPHIIIPNQVGKTSKNENRNIVIGDELREYYKFKDLKTKNPMERGFITDWSLEKEIWDYVFKRDDLKIKPSETSLLLIESPFAMEDIRKSLYQVVFESYKFKSLCLASSTTLGLINYRQENPKIQSSPCHLMVDCGYSSTLIAPHFQNSRLNYAIKRFDVGGKLLTNYLKEIVSLRHWDVMNETRLMNTIKERVCFLSLDFLKDLESSRNPSSSPCKIDYMFPDFKGNNNTGYIKTNEENKDQLQQNENKDTEMKDDNAQQQQQQEKVLTLTNERFSVPELIFNPSDVGINQAGLAESIVQSVNSTNPNLHIPLYSNIILLGGSTLFPNFKERLLLDLRKLVPESYNINIYQPEDPILCPIYGGIKFSQQADFHKYSVSKAEYDEYGYILCNRRFY
eukprot:gene652-807_t